MIPARVGHTPLYSPFTPLARSTDMNVCTKAWGLKKRWVGWRQFVFIFILKKLCCPCANLLVRVLTCVASWGPFLLWWGPADKCKWSPSFPRESRPRTSGVGTTLCRDKQSERMKVVCGEREGYNNTVALLFVGGRGSKEKFVLFVRGKLDGRVRYNASHGGAVASPKAQ